jgi:hypothetical protein
VSDPAEPQDVGGYDFVRPLLVSVDQASTQLLQKVLEELSIRFECGAGIRLVQEITNSTIGLLLGSALTIPRTWPVVQFPSSDSCACGAGPAYGFTDAQALRLKEARTSPLTFVPDEHDVSHLPGWVRALSKLQTVTLGKLAHANGAVLATLDESISASYLIPN